MPEGIDQHRVIEAIDPDKDVDGIHPYNIGKLLQGRPDFPPCTPAGIVELLLRNGHDTTGANVVICGTQRHRRQAPAALLMQRGRGGNATVTVCHTRTRNLPEVTGEADILVAAIGQPGAITADMVGEGAVVIGCGHQPRRRPHCQARLPPQGRCGLRRRVRKSTAITPVPGGVGPMTIAMLLVNTLTAARISVTPLSNYLKVPSP